MHVHDLDLYLVHLNVARLASLEYNSKKMDSDMQPTKQDATKCQPPNTNEPAKKEMKQQAPSTAHCSSSPYL